MKKVLSFLVILILIVSCKEEIVEKPDNLIEKNKMVDIMYDLAILEGIKYQNITSLADYNMNSSQYIYKKYKIDSLQFVQSNVYYASNYEEYKEFFDEIVKRIDDQKAVVDSLVLMDVKKKVKLDSIKLKKGISTAKNTVLLPFKKTIQKLNVGKKTLKKQ